MLKLRTLQIIEYLLTQTRESAGFDFNEETLKTVLQEEGFKPGDIEQVLNLFRYEERPVQPLTGKSQPVRAFHELENLFIPKRVRGLLVQLMEAEILDAVDIEILSERILNNIHLGEEEKVANQVILKYILERDGKVLYLPSEKQSFDETKIH